MQEIEDKIGFVINSFNSDKNYFIHQLKDCSINDFKIFSENEVPKETNKDEYLKICSGLVKKLKDNQFKKVVLSRVMKTKTNHQPMEILNQLNENYKNTFNYVVSIENVGCWIGTTPEMLAEFENKSFKTVALAGTKTDLNTSWSCKEIEEQQYVTDFIYRQVKPLVMHIEKTPTQTIKAGQVYHLKTNFTAELKNKKDWTNIVNTLHPTPATCGLPKNQSQKLINAIEMHQRLFYTGFLGLINPNYKLLMVNLRCMQIINGMAYLYLGGGITAQSVPEQEWIETQNKAKTLLSVI